MHTLREVYTSTHWLVRVYEVLKPPAFIPPDVFATGGYKPSPPVLVNNNNNNTATSTNNKKKNINKKKKKKL